ncbi:MAG: VirE protein [Bacteroides sp.]|nr:VirE protein [Bacteroides sp.]
MKFGIGNNVKSRVVRTCTPELFHQAVDSRKVAQVCAEIADAREMYLRGELTKEEFETKKAELKKRLPILTPHATFTNERRLNAEAIPSGMSMYDLDHIPNPQERWAEIAPRKEELGIVLAHITPSTEGLRLFFIMPQGMNLGEAQAWMAKQLGDTDYDVCVKDYARSSFLVPREYLLFVDEERLFSEEVDPLPSPLKGETVETTNPTSSPLLPEGGELSSGNHADAARRVPTFPTTYKGVPYSEILAAIVEELGGEPEEGERNAKVLRMASSLRHICDNNAEWLMEIIPTYGLPEEEWKKTIQNACKDGLKYGTTKVLQAALSKLRVMSSELRVGDYTALTNDSALSTQNSELNSAPKMPNKLPSLIKLLTSNVPDYLKPAVAHAVFPALGAHLGGVYFRYNDNVKRQATFMNVLVAMQSCGKSAINKPLEMIMADIEERDMANRQREQEWKNQQQKKKSNERGKDRPTDLCIQVLSPNMTQAAFVQKQQDAGEEFLYTQTDEIDTFKQLQVGGATQIFRLAFDNGYYGQERVGSQSVTARVQIRWNWNTAGTVQRVRDFFRHAIADGTISRLNFCTIDTDFANEMPCYGEYDDQFRDELKAYIDRLNEAEGLITCEEATQLAKQIMEGMNEIGILTDDEAYRILSRRANVIGFLKAMTLFVAEGGWSPEIAEFVKWSVEYDMWCKMQVFGDMLQSELESENLPPQQRKNLLYMLPDTFTREDALNLRKRIGKNNNVNGMLRQWVHREYIVFDMEKNVYVKTDARYKRYERYSKK